MQAGNANNSMEEDISKKQWYPQGNMQTTAVTPYAYLPVPKPNHKPTSHSFTADKNHIGLSPHGISAIHGFVLTSDQVHPQGSTMIGSRIGTYFSRGFGVYSRVFGAIWLSSGLPSTTRGTLCGTYVDTSTWYSSYMIHAGISIPTVATYWLHLSYSGYAQSMLIPTKPTYHGLSPHATLTYRSLIPSSRPTKNIIHLTFSPDITPSVGRAMSL